MIRHLLLMSGFGGGGECESDCSGRGECQNGTCFCEIRFSGNSCDGLNIGYQVGIGGMFLFVAFVCAVQLLMCIIFEYQRLKTPTLLKACRVTTQKMLYFIAFLASLIRGAYFTSPSSLQSGWSSSLMSAYYPLLMTGSSLIICFWAELFHLQDISWERSQFLSKSFLGFVTFNVISYSLFLAEYVTTNVAATTSDKRNYYTHIFNGCYAVLLCVVVIFFLVYGVEVYFKVRGGFTGQTVTSISSGKSSAATEEDDGASTSFNDDSRKGLEPKVDTSQLHQSRIGLLSQALMLIIISGFLFSETVSELWKEKVALSSRNWHDIVFRAVEIGVAVWFPCVLWNCMSPSELWILNPRKLFARLEPPEASVSRDENDAEARERCGEDEAFLGRKECWICYDCDKPEPLIQPCRCTGDVSSVHHDCLRRWLMESAASSADNLQCKVCGTAYQVQHSARLNWERGFTARHWGSTVLIVILMCITVAGAWALIQIFEDPYIRMLSASGALLVIYVCIKFLGLNTVSAYQRAKVGALNIMGGHVSTISETIAIDVTKTQQPAAI